MQAFEFGQNKFFVNIIVPTTHLNKTLLTQAVKPEERMSWWGM